MNNLNGLDEAYFKGKLQLVLKGISNYTPEEISRELARLAKTADSDVAALEVLHCHPDNKYQIIKNCFRESQGLRERIAELEARLEIDPRTKYDGIDCRDATIKELDFELRVARTQLYLESTRDEWLESVKMAKQSLTTNQ